MKQYFTSLFIALTITSTVHAQYAADFRVYKCETGGERSAQKLLQSLVGDGIVLKSFSITKTSSDEAFGFFEDRKARLGMKKGLVMTTGGIAGLSSKNTSGAMSNNTHSPADRNIGGVQETTTSAELEKLLGNNQKTFDACVIELDVVPTADTLSFNYVFGSEEYDEYVGTEFNDAFAFLISGKGINGEKNLAVVPGTETPVSVNSINNGTSTTYNRSIPSNPTYYRSNTDGQIGIEYDGMTKLMEIRQPVIPYETYHIKLAIADVADNSFDSGVLLEGKSIVSYEKSYNVLFDKNSSEIDPSYKNLLNELSKQYKEKTTGNIIVTGHTDSEGSAELNQDLSCKRAQEIAAYITKQGVSESRIQTACKGESMPTHDNYSERGKAYNRRTEIKLLGSLDIYYERKKPTTVGEEAASLFSNYPNPFIGTTTIDALVPEKVKDAYVLVSDITGKMIKLIYLLERGKTSVTFDAQNLNPGIYNATLVTDGNTSGNLKMVVQK